jgi:hypothetical protein
MTLKCTLSCGDASHSDDCADLVFTDIYAPLPRQLVGIPAIINVVGKKPDAEEWVGSRLDRVSEWGRRVNNTICVSNQCVIEVDLTDMIEDEITPGVGFMPLELPLRVLRLYGSPGITVWDGFMGRGTIGKAALSLGMNYIGIDNDPDRVKMAREYIG